MWESIEESSLDPAAKRLIVPLVYRTVRLDTAALAQSLAAAPMEFTGDATQNPIIYLPMPDGTMARFRFEESPIMEPGLAVKFPGLKTYRAQGIDDPAATSRFDWLPTGFHAIILAPSGTVLIDPYAQGNTTDYITYWKNDAANSAEPFECHFIDPELPSLPARDVVVSAVNSGTTLRTYRLALASTNEYTVAVGGNTIAGALVAEVLIMNRVNGVYERDLAIHMNIVANNDLITYAGDNLSCGGPCTAANDPYTNNNTSTMLDENQSNINAVIGSTHYDIGHVFGTGGGGYASIGVSCGSSKARGVTGLSHPVGDAFAIDYVAHEMGHQWGAWHTFNSTAGNCGGVNRSDSSAYEPGSGITIMAYAGICGNQNLAAHSIDTFHGKSLEQIVAYSQSGNGNTCAVTTATGNTPPTVTGPGAFTIPKGSPFSLTASATDPNGDSITYDWEEYDLDAGGGGTTAVPNTDSDGTARPIFRPYSPTVGGTRTFPSLQYILDNANVPPATTGGFLTGELLPAISRAMTFQVVARDNRANGGGINTATSVVTIDGDSGPFAVTAPNTAISTQRLTNFNVTWDVSGTAAPPVNAANVKISLSIDGGTTFPIVLLASTPNDGAVSLLIPDLLTTTARIKIEAVGNIFFDISDTDFSIVSGVQSPTPTPTPTPPATPTPTPPPPTPTATPTPTPDQPPAAPTNLSATAISSSEIALSWTDNANNETGFQLQQSNDGVNFSLIATVGANVTTYTDDGLTAGTTYYYRVRAFNSSGTSASSNVASATISTQPPAAPTNLVATAISSSEIALSWTDNSNNETGFQLQQSNDGVNFSLIATVGANVTTYTDNGLTAGTTYYYRVRAFNSSGTSAPSNVASATISTQPPAAPTNLVATAISSSEIALSWTDNSNNETGFQLQQSNDGVNFSLIATVDSNVTTYTDNGLTAGTTYYYRVRAFNSSGTSAPSNVASATTTP